MDLIDDFLYHISIAEDEAHRLLSGYGSPPVGGYMLGLISTS